MVTTDNATAKRVLGALERDYDRKVAQNAPMVISQEAWVLWKSFEAAYTARTEDDYE